jgi:DNA-directed RNA polymerase subunit beta
MGRSAAFDSIVKGERISLPNLPASFNVLLNNLRGLALDVGLMKDGRLIENKKGREKNPVFLNN